MHVLVIMKRLTVLKAGFIMNSFRSSRPVFFSGMLKDLSLAVDVITVHFSSRQEAEEKVVPGGFKIQRRLFVKHGKWDKTSWLDVLLCMNRHS